jgi:hypothetical protein
VLDRLEASYDFSHTERFYLHGDGGSWIQAGLDILPNCTFIPDGFHPERELRRLCGGGQRVGVTLAKLFTSLGRTGASQRSANAGGQLHLYR